MIENHVDVLLITGPSGVGKSTICWKLSATLVKHQIAHVVLDTDELDRVFPKPRIEQLHQFAPEAKDVSAIHLASMWKTYSAMGYHRIIMSGIMRDISSDTEWIKSAIPNSNITIVRLLARYSTLRNRLTHRELCHDIEEQAIRSFDDARNMAVDKTDDVHIVQTDEKTPVQLAEWIMGNINWFH